FVIGGTGNSGVLKSSESHTQTPRTPMPTVSVAPGEVPSGTSIILQSISPSAVIHYTTDGSTPTTASPVYSSPIIVSESITIKAIANRLDWGSSRTMSASYTVSVSPAEAPTATPVGGAVASGTTVALATTTAGATIHYTTDGTPPTASSPVYSTPIAITSDQTIKAIAVKSGMSDSSLM